MAAVRDIRFVVTSSYCIWEHYFTVLTLYHIFKSIGLVVSNILGLSCFIILAWYCYFGGQIWHFWGKLSQMLKLNILTPKRHILSWWFRAFWAIVRQNRSKCYCLISARASQNKINKKSHKKVAFTYLPISLPWTDFYLERTFPSWT